MNEEVISAAQFIEIVKTGSLLGTSYVSGAGDRKSVTIENCRVQGEVVRAPISGAVFCKAN